MVPAKTKESETVSAETAAAMLGVAKKTVLQLFKHGELEGYKVTGGLTARILIYRDSVERFIREVQKGRRV